MGYYEKLEEKELKAKQAKEMQDLKDKNKGFTPAVRKLKNQLVEMDSRAVVKQMNNVGGFLRYDPKDARQLQGQLKVRAELMSDPKEFFGTLDHRIVRKSYEFEALNHRQRETILSQYKWMYTELVQEPNPLVINDVWYLPLHEAYEQLSELEQMNFAAGERMGLLYEELKNVDNQPTSIIEKDEQNIEVVFYPTILKTA